VQYTRFEPGQEPSVLTSISECCSEGKCEVCPGIFHREEYPEQSIYCVHTCHIARNQAA